MLGEDNVLVREGVRALLDSYEDVEVVGVAADAPSLLSAAEEHTPDVVVTDIKMPPNFQLEGIDCAHAIREDHPGTGVVVLSAHDDEAYAIALLGKGQSGLAYLLKDRIAQGDELVRAIREVAAGGSAVDPLIAERLSGRRETGEHDRELLELMSQGLGYEQMAENLGTTPEAVDRRVTQLFTRMAAQAEGGGAAAVDEMKRLHAAVVQKQATATAFRSFVPEQVAAKLQASGSTELREELDATILFSDIRGYSTLAEHLAPAQVAELVGGHLAAMAEVIIGHGGMVDQFVGDAVMAVFGAPEPTDDHAERAVVCALAMQARQAELNRGRRDRRPADDRDGDRDQHRPRDGRDGRRRGPARVHGGRGRREHRGPAPGRGGRRGDRGERDDDRGGRHRRGRADRHPPREGPRGARRRLPGAGPMTADSSAAPMRPARWPWVALGGFFLMAIFGTVGIVVNDESLAEQLPFIIAFSMFGVVGAMVLSRAPGNRIGGLLMYGSFATAIGFVSGELTTYLFDRGTTEGPVVVAAALISSIGWVLGILPVLFLLPLLFPGRPSALAAVAPGHLGGRRVHRPARRERGVQRGCPDRLERPCRNPESPVRPDVDRDPRRSRTP